MEADPMHMLETFARRSPLLFGSGMLLVLILMLIASAALGALLPGEGYASLGGLVGRLVSSAALLALLARLGWLRSAGLASPGPWRAWLLLPLPVAYAVGAAAVALTGRLSLSDFGPAPADVVIVFIAASALMEGVAFRGLILHAFVRAWGSRGAGGIRSVLAAALFFGIVHLLDALSGRPLVNVLLQSMEAGILGIWLGALALIGKSLYPAVVFHGLFNLAGYLLFGRQGLEPAPAAWLLLGLLILPLAAFGLWLLGKAPQRDLELRAVASGAGQPSR
jgi:membrane protease YdiL (CAAX protease family)